MSEHKLREVGTSTYPWVYKRDVVSKNDTKKFVVLNNRRDIRNTHVSKLRRILEAGEHYDTPLVVNFRNGKYRLLDGNHRYESMCQLLEKYPERKIAVGLCVYTDLDDAQEKVIYTRWNSGSKQNFNDFVKQYWDDISVALKMERSFACKVRPSWGGSGVMEFRSLMKPYVTHKRNPNTQDMSFQGGAMDFIHACQNLDTEDYKITKAFMTEYMSIFGVPDRKNKYYCAPTFPSMFGIWLKNYERISAASMRKKLAKITGHERFVYWCGQGGTRTNVYFCMRDLTAVMNASVKRETNKLLLSMGEVVDGQHRLEAVRELIDGEEEVL